MARFIVIIINVIISICFRIGIGHVHAEFVGWCIVVVLLMLWVGVVCWIAVIDVIVIVQDHW